MCLSESGEEQGKGEQERDGERGEAGGTGEQGTAAFASKRTNLSALITAWHEWDASL